MHPRFGGGDASGAREQAGLRAGTDLGRLYANLADFRQLAEVEEHHVEALCERVRPAPVVRVPFLPSDVHDLDGLAALGVYLFDGEAATV